MSRRCPLDMNWRVATAALAAERAANLEHRQLARGLGGLATVSATGPWLGMLATVFLISSSFVGCGGEKWTCLAAVVSNLSDALIPAAFGVALATIASFARQSFAARLAVFDVEMQAAILDLPRLLRPLS